MIQSCLFEFLLRFIHFVFHSHVVLRQIVQIVIAHGILDLELVSLKKWDF